MQEIIGNVMNNRVATIHGIPGIGKTTIAKAVAFYLDERNQYKDGIILMSLRKIDQIAMFLTRLYLIINTNLPKDAPNDNKEEKMMEDYEVL
mmetsp:Transcript_10357/g.10390  ORF Transcript_10357/g.10390 Transcript_10357/m.10390 type:complete len:92 (-) Transcript_10357:1113-1388(-)